jgi:iron complex transport system substrate-binding protein
LGGAFVVLSGCRGAAKDPSAARRVVSTSPSMTETIFAVGRGAELVGRSRFCDYPPEAASIPEIGGFADPSLEKILALTPTLVCGERGPAGPDLPASLEKQGIETYFPRLETVADIESMIEELAAKLDARAAGAAVAERVRARIREVGERVKDAPRPRVLLLFDWRPLVAAGPKSFPDELLALAGATNVVTEGGQYPKLGVEGVIALDPDVVLDGSAGAYAEPPEAIARATPGLDALRATKAGRLHRLGSTAALRPGPRIGEGVAEIARLVHGGAS